MFELVGLAAASSVAAVLTLIFNLVLRHPGPFGRPWPFSLIVMAGSWLCGGLVTDYWTPRPLAFWLSYVGGGLLTALTLAWVGDPGFKRPAEGELPAGRQPSVEVERRRMAGLTVAASYAWFVLLAMFLITLAWQWR